MAILKQEHKEDGRLPEWAPEGAGEAFASRVRAGVETRHDGLPVPHGAKRAPLRRIPAARALSVEDYVNGIRAGDRMVLARAITLVESNLPAHGHTAQEVLCRVLPFAGKSIRVGITGVPGVGKSTFIESFGCHLLEQGHRVAVLAVDPSSALTRGSILGDKTRMEKLSRDTRCFIRPSPSGGALGGVSRKTRETILLCEAAGHDVILVETVGVGQSEITVRSMVDFFLLLMLAGAGDELQGIKKGIMELADALVITKADGDNTARAETARAEYERALHYLMPASGGWKTRTLTCSALTGTGIPEIWTCIGEFRAHAEASNQFFTLRTHQTLDWMRDMVHDQLRCAFESHPVVQDVIRNVERQVLEGRLPAAAGAHALLDAFFSSPHRMSESK